MVSAPMVSAHAIGAGCLEGTTVGTGDGALELLRVQPEGKPAMEAAAWRRGLHLDASARLGT